MSAEAPAASAKATETKATAASAKATETKATSTTGAISGLNAENNIFLKKIGFKDFIMDSSLNNADDYLLKVTISDTDMEKFFTNEGNKESLIYILKNDSVFKEVFKDDNREAEAIEDIKKKIEEYKSDDFYISDLFDFLNNIKKFIIEKNKETKGIDNFINNFSDKLDKLLEEKIENTLDENQEGYAKKIFRL
tara:strand:- start:506 stop:1087 length:582 start_codon:yes stop_codon:yes gene_type:complete